MVTQWKLTCLFTALCPVKVPLKHDTTIYILPSHCYPFRIRTPSKKLKMESSSFLEERHDTYKNVS